MDTLNLKSRLKEGKFVYGPFVRTSDPVLTEIIGYAGFDFVVIDLEHGPNSIGGAENLVRAAKQSGLSPIIRVREASETMVLRALDTGASGVQIPQINTVHDAEKMIQSSKFYPAGNRGVCKYTRNAEYSKIPVDEYFEKANRETLMIVQVEGKQGVENLDKILEVNDIDVVFIGPYDLSQSLGLTGQVEHPTVLKEIEKITTKARNKNIAVGCFGNTVEALKRQKNMGIQYLCSFIDTGFIYESLKSIRDQLRI